MKNIVKISNGLENYKPNEIALAFLYHFIIGAAGFIAARSIVIDKLLPFGLSFACGCSITYTPAAAIGVFIGYFIPAVSSGGFKYIAALFAILAIKLLLSGYTRLVRNPLFLSFISILASFFTSAVTLQGFGGNLADIITESLLVAVGSFFFARSSLILSKTSSGFSTDELATALVSLCIMLIGLNTVSFGGISLGKILGILLVLIASKYGGITSGAISGITVALSLLLSSASSSIALSVAFAGLATGIFCSLGKYAQVITMVIFVFISSAVTGDMEIISKSVIECVLAAVLFIILPRQAGSFLGKAFCVSARLAIPDGYKKTLTMRLQLASNALKDVSQTVDKVSHELSKINSPDFGTVINSIEQEACAGCKIRVHCWENRRDDTINAILEMTKAVKQGEVELGSFAPQEFKGRCLRPSKMENAVYKHYTNYASNIAAESRIDEVRSVVSDQFEGISSMLNDLAEDLSHDEQFDSATAETAALALKNLNIHANECSARIDKFGRMTLEFKLKKTPELIINKMQVMKLVSAICERDFDIPLVNEVGGDIFMILCERAEITVDIGVEQICANGCSMCGDAYKYFNDGRGHFIMVLSDGMGTGGRAAVDGAMASGLMSRLIKAGFGYDCALRILNSSMLFKSTDESLATVDIASIDLYSGITELYKAGAAPTLVRRSGKSGKAESSSLPAGILRDISFDKAHIKCKAGDIVVLMSDGAVSEGTDWIRAEIAAWQEGGAQELSEHLAHCAKRRREQKHDDDITVMCAILNKVPH